MSTSYINVMYRFQIKCIQNVLFKKNHNYSKSMLTSIQCTWYYSTSMLHTSQFVSIITICPQNTLKNSHWNTCLFIWKTELWKVFMMKMLLCLRNKSLSLITIRSIQIAVLFENLNSISWRQLKYQCMEILRCLPKNRLHT